MGFMYSCPFPTLHEFEILDNNLPKKMVCSSTLIEQDINPQNMTNASRLNGVENDSSSASVTASIENYEVFLLSFFTTINIGSIGFVMHAYGCDI